MVEQLLEFTSEIVTQCQRADVLTFAFSGVILLNPRDCWQGRGLVVLLGRFAVCVLASSAVNVIMDHVYANFYLETVLSGVMFCLINGDFPWPKRISLASVITSAWIYSSSLGIMVMSWGASGASMVLLRALYMVVVLAIMWALQNRVMGEAAEVSWPFAVLMLVVCLSGVFMQVILRESIADYNDERMLENLIICLCGQLTVLVAYGMFALTVRNHNDALQAHNEQQFLRRRLEALQAFRLSEQSLHELRHEVKNQYAYIRTVLERGDLDGAKAFFDEMSLQADPTLSIVVSGNELVDDIVNLEISKARAEGVKMDARVVVPAVLPYEEVDLCGLITNVVDNAIEAAKQTPDFTVSLTITGDVDQGAFMVCTSNPCEHPPKMQGGRMESSKREPGHGYGTAIVARIAEKYDGVADFAYEDGLFTASVMLALPRTIGK